VSLNADTEENYDRICSPKFGKGTYGKVIGFIKDCVANNIDTEVTCLDLPDISVIKCEKIARDLGARFRLRAIGVVG